MKKISVIIPTFNRKNYLRRLLQQIHNSKITDIELFVVIVVDGSTDGTIEMLAIDFPDVHIVYGDGTWWYTRSMNEGFKYVINNLKSNFILCLNDDIRLSENYINNLFICSKKLNSKFILGSLSLNDTNPITIAFSGIKKINRFFDITQHYIPMLSEVNNEKLSGCKDSKLLPGRGLLIPIEAIKELNGFDPFFFQYQSDYDFCLRAQKIGYNCFISYDAKLFSDMALTSNVTSYKTSTLKSVVKAFFQITSRVYIPNRALYYWRHYYKILFPIYFIKFLLITLYKNVIKRKKLNL